MSFFSKLFGKNEVLPPADLSVLGVDMHSHFLFGIDDGAQTVDDSIALLREMEAFGYKKVVCTPHIMSDHFRNTPEIILGKRDEVREAAKANGINLQIEAAAEYYFDYEFEGKIGKEQLLTFGKNYLLFEVSYMNAPDGVDAVIFNLLLNGYKPVLAHPERYPFWYDDNFKTYDKLKEKGALFQININSLTGHYSPGAKKIAEKMIERGMVEFLGTDCHRMSHIELMRHAQTNKHLHQLLASGNLLNATL